MTASPAIAVRTGAFALLFVVAFAGRGLAQEPVSSFAQLPQVVKPGNIVFVQDEKGERTKGKITELSETSLQIVTGGAFSRTLTFNADRVVRVSKVDSRLNGFILGAVAGAVPGLFLGHLFNQHCKNESPDYCPGAYAYAAGVLGVAGGGIGYAIDGAIDGQTLAFRRAGSSPGLQFSFRF